KYFESSACYNEYRRFKEREQLWERAELILPLYFQTSDFFEKKSGHSGRIVGGDGQNSWRDDLRGRQYKDFRTVLAGTCSASARGDLIEATAKAINDRVKIQY